MSIHAMVRDLPSRGSEKQKVSAGEPSQLSTAKEKALQTLAKFIPVEVLAPYAAALSLSKEQEWDPTDVYVVFVIATPLTTMFFKYAESASSGSEWPELGPLIWRAIASGFAFGVWALVVPLNPLQDDVGGAAVAGFAAIVVSPVLAAIDAIVLRLLSSGS